MGKYTDSEFPANSKSINGFRNNNQFNQIVWKRPEEFLQGSIKVFDKIEPGDIFQGALGDCYLLAAIASIATHS